jgi:FixJ family two-component response regulator
LRVYIIDADRAVQDSFKWLIESLDVECDTYGSSRDFLHQVTSGEVRDCACVVAEAQLPGISGVDLPDILCRMGHPWPVIVTSGLGSVEEATAAIKAGASDYLEKPLASGCLLNRLRELAVPQPSPKPAGEPQRLHRHSSDAPTRTRARLAADL